MKMRLICGIFACILLLTCMPAYIFATGTEPTPTGEGTGTPTETPTDPTDAEGYVNDISQALLDVVKLLEAFSETCFWDYKQASIGYGTVCQKCTGPNTAGSHTITKEQAEADLHKELRKCIEAVYNFSKRYQIKFKQHEFDALVSFSYNVGYSWSTDTGNGLHKALVAGTTGSAMVYRILLYGSAGGEYILWGRRTVEANIFINGVYSTSPYDASTYPPNYRYIFVDGAGGKVNYRIHGFDANEALPVMAQIKTAPKDAYGNNCVFDGWYTQRDGGTRIEALDDSFVNGTVIYAHWKDSRGEPIVIPEREYFRLEVTVTGNNVNLRGGPQTYYKALGQAKSGDKLQVTQIARGDGLLWGRSDRGWIALKYTDYDTVMKAMSIKGKVITDEKIYKVPVEESNLDKKEHIVGTTGAGADVTIVGLDTTMRLDNGTLITWGKIGENQWIRLDNVIYDPIPGDVDDNGVLDDQDAVRLLMHYLFPNDYTIQGEKDTNGDGIFNDRDAVHLLMHYLFPADYPLHTTSQ